MNQTSLSRTVATSSRAVATEATWSVRRPSRKGCGRGMATGEARLDIPSSGAPVTRDYPRWRPYSRRKAYYRWDCRTVETGDVASRNRWGTGETGATDCPAMSSDRSSSITFLRILLVLIGSLSVLLVLPFLQYVLLAGLMAYLVAPVNDRLSRRLGSVVAAVVTILFTVVVVLGPLALIVGVAAEQAVSLASGTEVPDVATVETVVQQRLGTDADLQTLLEPYS